MPLILELIVGFLAGIAGLVLASPLTWMPLAAGGSANLPSCELIDAVEIDGFGEGFVFVSVGLLFGIVGAAAITLGISGVGDSGFEMCMKAQKRCVRLCLVGGA